jgi:hypothetical protein
MNRRSASLSISTKELSATRKPFAGRRAEAGLDQYKRSIRTTRRPLDSHMHLGEDRLRLECCSTRSWGVLPRPGRGFQSHRAENPCSAYAPIRS